MRVFSRMAKRAQRLVARTAERRCDRRLATALDRILAASPEELQDVDRLTRLVGAAGLAHDPRGLYGTDEVYCNRIPRGLYQIPRQLARFLVFLSRRDVRTVLEIGTYTGHTFAVVMTYLSRFHPGAVGVTVDIADTGPARAVATGRFSGRFTHGTAADFAGQVFDLCMIDADHSYDAVRADYEMVGARARLCMFHDINDKFVEEFEGNAGGVPRFWRELKARRPALALHEFCCHTEGRSVMGIGVVERGTEADGRAWNERIADA